MFVSSESFEYPKDICDWRGPVVQGYSVYIRVAVDCYLMRIFIVGYFYLR